MNIKTASAGAILATGAVLSPFLKVEPKQTDTNTVVKEQQGISRNKLIMPAWIPVTADGKFDEKKANKQAELLWAEYGKDILRFSADVKTGMPGKIAFNKFAIRLAKGNKKKEKQILSLYDSVKKTYAKRGGEMKDTPHENVPVSILFGLTCGLMGTFVAFGSSMTMENKKSIKKITLGTVIGVTALGFLGSLKTQNTYCSQKTFVQVQKAAYDEYHKKMIKNWTMTDIQSAKKMLDRTQKTK